LQAPQLSNGRILHPCVCDRRRKTPLHHAAVNGDPAVVELLLSHGADLHAKDEYGCEDRQLSTPA
jgi:ankyrin repeat protein